MSRLLQLKKKIEHERKILDGMVAGADDITLCCVQSQKLDELVDEYYRLEKQEYGVEKDGNCPHLFPTLYFEII